MNIGMLWFDNSETALSIKIERAVGYYRNKYNRIPDLCLVHPSMLKDSKLDENGITVRPYRPVLPGHLWLGIEDNK